MAFERGYKDLQHAYHSAAAVTAGLSFPHCLGNPVCAYGNQLSQDLSVPTVQRSKQRAECIHHPAHCQFFLDAHFFQRTGIRIRFHLAIAAVALGFVDDPDIPQDRSSCCQAPNPLSALALLCCVSEPRCLVSEPLAEPQKTTCRNRSFLFFIKPERCRL